MFLFLVACSGMSAQEAHMVFDETNDVGFRAFRAVQKDSDTATARDSGTFTWTAEDDGFTFEGSLVGDGTNDWTGQLDLLGAASWTTDTWSGDWSIDYIEVVQEDIGLDGSMDWSLDLEGDYDSASAFYSCQGEIAASGAASGTGVVDYTVSVEVDGTSISMVAEGEIDGTPIDSSFSLTFL